MCPQKSAIFFPKKVEVKGYFKIFQKFIKFCIDRPIKLQGPWSKHQPNNSTRPHRKLRRTRSWKGSTQVLLIPRGATFLASLRHPATSAIYNTKCFSTVFTNAIQLFIVSRSTQHVNWHPPTLIYLSSSHIHIFKTQFSGCSWQTRSPPSSSLSLPLT